MNLKGTITIKPCPKPRMTRRDKWLRPVRPPVVRYRVFCRELNNLIDLGDMDIGRLDLVFHIQMPPSWSKKKKTMMCGQWHRNKPDVDNYLKAFMDALLKDDSGVYDTRSRKKWTDKPSYIEYSIYESEGV